MANPFQGNVLKNEPALIYGLVNAIIALVISFGFSLSEDQVGGIMAVTSILLAIVTRMFVTPVKPAPPPTTE